MSQFIEDRIYRHLEPALAFQLEINRMRNFDLEAIPVTNHRMHMYLGRAKVSESRRAAVRPSGVASRGCVVDQTSNWSVVVGRWPIPSLPTRNCSNVKRRSFFQKGSCDKSVFFEVRIIVGLCEHRMTHTWSVVVVCVSCTQFGSGR